MAYTNIDDPSAYFQTLAYTANTDTPSQTFTNNGNSDLKPDWLWVKNRSGWGNRSHNLFDSSRGVNKRLKSDTTAAEDTTSNQTFNTNGFTVPEGFEMAYSGPYVAWQWKCNGGTTSTNTTGNGIDSVVQANTTAGFSIVTYTGNGTQSGQTVGHGLGAVPKMIISKDRTNSSNVVSWRVYHVGIGPTKYIELQSNAAQSTFNDWDDTAPTSSVYSVGGAGGYTPTNTNNALYVAYVFADVQGYSRFSSYIGNGNADGAFVYTGFKPAWVLIKQVTDAAGDDWILYDNKREPENVAIKKLFPNQSAAESSSYDSIDMLSNGFKARTNLGGTNSSGKTYIYMAFAENPFVTSTGIPTTAR